MTGPIIRILLRYLSGFLVAKGLLPADLGNDLATDADLINVAEVAAGAVIGIATELAYFIGRKLGWRT